MGYAGINNNLAIEFDIQGNAWDPNSNHVAVQSCGPATNTPVHLPGAYTIGQNHNVTSCLLSQNAINTSVPAIGENCSGFHCIDGAVHQVVVEYTPPAPNQQLGTLQVWLDPQFIHGNPHAGGERPDRHQRSLQRQLLGVQSHGTESR